MVKKRTKELIDAMKRNTDNHFYMSLKEYAETRIYEVQELLVKETDMDNIMRLQGRATEMRELLDGLTRKPIAEQYEGAFN